MSDRQGLDRRTLIVAGVLVMLAVIVGLRYFSGPPQIGADEEVVKTVDALFTAMTTKDRSRLDDCDQRLKAHEQAGRLSAKPAQALAAMIKQARDGQWEPASKKLYAFIYGQRGL